MKRKYQFNHQSKKYGLLLALLTILICSTLQAQINCSTIPETAYDNHHHDEHHETSGRSSSCDDPITFVDDYETIDEFIVYVNVHLYPNPGEEISDPVLAVEMARNIVSRANEVLANLARVTVPGPDGVTIPPRVPNAKYSYQIYHDPNNPDDIHDGVWLHPEQSCNSGIYDHRVVDIHLGGDGSCGEGIAFEGDAYLNGGLEACFISTYQEAINSGNYNEWYARAKLVNHEIGHTLGLDHVAYCDNLCSTIDINPIEECQSNFTDDGIFCDDPAPLYIDGTRVCTWGHGNNMMQQGFRLNAITPCQWEIVFNHVANSCSPKYNWCQDDCQLTSFPTEVNDGENIIWTEENTAVFDPITINNGGILTINSQITSMGNITVETGGELYINGTISMGDNRRIFVKRGAKLVVDGGKITSGTNECSSSWKGILVHGNANKIQPDFPFDNLQPDDAGVVVLKNGAIIMHASTGISTKAPGYSWPEQKARWGGVIHATDSYFINNKRAVEFMKYNGFQNKSVFDDCVFMEEGEYKEGTIGVTIWECKGITFTRNIFSNLDLSGILGIDYGANIHDGNQFLSMDRGIETMSTYPTGYDLRIGNEATLPNEFSDNHIHILSESADKGNKLIINNNNFYKATTIAIYIGGDSRFEIIQNSFADLSNGIEVVSAGDALNFINCNIFNNTTWGIRIKGNNSGTRFLGNTFENGWTRDISIEPDTSAIPGEVHPFQGSPGKPAHNCFYNFNSRDITADLRFKYYHDHNDNYCGAGAPFHNIPEDNLSDGGSANYTIHPTNPASTDDGHCEISLAPAEPPSQEELDDLRNTMANRFSIWQADIENIDKEHDYYEAYEAKTEALGWMLSLAIERGEYEEAESYLEAETSERSRKWKYGLKVLQEDYTGAQTLLETFPVSTTEEATYQEVQRINLDRMTSEVEYVLPAEDEAYLYNAANNSLSSGSTARSLLVLLTDARFEPEINNEEEPEERLITEQETPDQFILAPNPAKDEVILTYDIKKPETPSRVRLTNMSGSILLDEILGQTGKHTINTSAYPPGIYFLQITNGKESIYLERLAVIR